MHKFTAKGFGYTYISFLQSDKVSKEFKEKLSLRLPIHLHKLSPLMMTKCFEVTVENELMSEHLFDNHFYVLFRNRVQWFAECYPSIINNLVQLEYFDDPEFWNIVFLPAIKKINFKNDSALTELIVALNNLNEKAPVIKVSEYIKYLED